MTTGISDLPNYYAARAPGDRRPAINQIFPLDAFYHNGKNGRILDVTKPPFNAKGDGVSDDTQALVAAMRFVRDHYEILQGDDYCLCSQKHNRNWVVYLPDGEYLVSDTVSQGWPALAMDIRKGWSHVEYLGVDSPEHEEELYWDPATPPLLHGNPQTPAGNGGPYLRGQYNEAPIYAENNWNLRLIGQSRQNTVIRLKDAAAGFDESNPKPVLALYLLQRGSNVNLGNYCENISIDTGCGNPGAVGLKWNSSNWGGIRNVAIHSTDGQARIGLLTDANNATGYHRDLLIEGFDTGIEIAAGRETMVTLEYATLAGQNKMAIHLGDAMAGGGGDNLSARKLMIIDAPVALRAGRAGQAILLESELRTSTESESAMLVEPDGFLLARDIRVTGYQAAVMRNGQAVLGGETIMEYSSAEPVLLGDTPAVRLAVEDTPLILPEQDVSQWANVDDFGAVGDGITDDTAAVQKAMNSGKPLVYFPRANYVVNGTVKIPASVREITALFGSIHRNKASEFDAPGLFRVAEDSQEPLLIHRLTSAGGVLVDHDADRRLIAEDIYVVFNHARNFAKEAEMLFPSAAAQDTEFWRLYRNTRPAGRTKDVFVNSCIGFGSDHQDGVLAVENARVWGRMINTEHLDVLYSFRHCDAWIFGFKSENADTLLKATDQSRIEVLGGSFLVFSKRQGPVIHNSDSQVNATFFLWHWVLAADEIYRGDHDGITTNLAATSFANLATVDAALIYTQ
jgi:hypothetical protein